MRRSALITGVSGQDGSYLAELLLSKGYRVHGYTRDPECGLGCSNHLVDRLTIHSFNVECQRSWDELLASHLPDEVYHLAANSFIPNSWRDPTANNQANHVLTIRLLEAVRQHSPRSRLLNACSREIFGYLVSGPCTEETVMSPISPYGISKASSRWMVNSFRQTYGLYAANAILFNHESPRRPVSFVTRKISRAAAAIKLGLERQLTLGNIAAKRDWGFAGDFVEGMWQMLQLEKPEDFVLGTGCLHTIEEAVSLAFGFLGLQWRDYVKLDQKLIRDNDAGAVVADCTKAERKFGWRPTCQLEDLMKMMVQADMQELARYSARDGRAA